MDIRNITGRFLVAVPGLQDPNFSSTVVLICEHNAEGAFGLVINRILMNSYRSIIGALGIERAAVDLPVHYGGPVKTDQGYVLFSPFSEGYDAIRVSDDLGVTASREMLKAIAEGRGPARYLFALGFAGWMPSQMENELMEDSWLVAPLDLGLIFDEPVAERWRSAALSIGVDFDRYTGRSGSA